MMEEIKSRYQSQKEKYSTLFSNLQKRIKIISIIRLAVFVSAFLIIYLLSRFSTVSAIVITVLFFILFFLLLVKHHARLIDQKKLYEAYLKINKNELHSLEGKNDQFDPAKSYINPEHPYTSDLDIFGDGGIFQFLNRTVTVIGKHKLASLFIKPLMKNEEILNNQVAIKAIRDQFEWKQKFQAYGSIFNEKEEDKKRIIDWVKLPALFKSSVYEVLLFLIPICTLSMIVLLSINIISEQQFILYLVIPLGISGINSIRVNRRHLLVSKTSSMLNKYASLLNIIEELDVNSSKLIHLKAQLKQQNIDAAFSIQKLSKILNALDHRLSFFGWLILNGTVLWDILHMRRLEKWQRKNKELLPQWLDVIAEIDSLISLSILDFNNPDFSFPTLIDSKNSLEAESLGHPLIPQNVRVDNPVNISEGEFTIITGANMAGKSTFLRTIGVNIVLGMIGAPVCGKDFKFHPVQVYTSITTKDSLQKSESYFYSELKRLKQIIDELKNGSKLFIILDEILKGTNSKDKHAGSEALLKQFVSLNTFGIVATHDVILGQLEPQFPENIKNRCFEVEMKADKLYFDYKIRKGVSKNLNATHLMREMGITV